MALDTNTDGSELQDRDAPVKVRDHLSGFVRPCKVPDLYIDSNVFLYECLSF